MKVKNIVVLVFVFVLTSIQAAIEAKITVIATDPVVISKELNNDDFQKLPASNKRASLSAATLKLSKTISLGILKVLSNKALLVLNEFTINM